MPRDLFGDVTRPSISIGNRKWYTVPVSLLSHSAVIVALVAAPLIAKPFLPEPSDLVVAVFIKDPPPPPPPPPPDRNHPRPEPVLDPSIAPIDAPPTISPEREFDASFQQDSASIIDGIRNAGEELAPPPPPPPPVHQAPIRVGGSVRAPQKLRDVRPTYSAIALAARIQGIVIIEATIGVDGRVVDARVLRSVPMLDQAALDAVRQWEYTPTLLNGAPVPVIMTVTVTFTLK